MGILARAGTSRRSAPVDGGLPPESTNLDRNDFDYSADYTEYSFNHGGGGTTYPQLAMASNHIVPFSVHHTRVHQAARFWKTREDDLAPGCRVVLSDRSAPMTKAAKATAREIMAVLMSADHGYADYRSFEPAVSAMIRDSLTYDQACAEVLTTRKGKPYGFMPVDASLIRLARPTSEELNSERFYPDPDAKRYVKIRMSDYSVTNEYTQRKMIWGVRNRRTAEWARGYGNPELNQAHIALASLINAMTFNDVNFQSGMNANMVVAFHSRMKRKAQESVASAFRHRATGVRQSHRTPLLFLGPDDKMSSVTMNQSNKDMEYSNHINFLIKIFCAAYQMDPR
jgi:hypothetical protein